MRNRPFKNGKNEKMKTTERTKQNKDKLKDQKLNIRSNGKSISDQRVWLNYFRPKSLMTIATGDGASFDCF
jgi:hypothetical protein